MDGNLWSMMPPVRSPRSSSFKRMQLQMHDNFAFEEPGQVEGGARYEQAGIHSASECTLTTDTVI